MMATSFAPFSIASMQHCILGIMPPAIVPSAMYSFMVSVFISEINESSSFISLYNPLMSESRMSFFGFKCSADCACYVICVYVECFAVKTACHR